jgi:uncharacterized membrane protein YdjX (TVP38/TMEM64 family)
MRTANTRVWVRAVVLLGAVGALFFAVRHGAILSATTPQELADWLAPHRGAWYALPAVVFAFVSLGLAFVPVLLLITATGVAFGPVLGPLYAMAGCLASASTGFAIGRWAGLGRLERFGGERAARIARTLGRNGVLAVFLLRKVPAPFLLSNIIAGASPVRYRDFLIGTVLGMGLIVVALASFGHQLTRTLANPTPATLVGAAVFATIALTFAWFINRALRPGPEES